MNKMKNTYPRLKIVLGRRPQNYKNNLDGEVWIDANEDPNDIRAKVWGLLKDFAECEMGSSCYNLAIVSYHPAVLDVVETCFHMNDEIIIDLDEVFVHVDGVDRCLNEFSSEWLDQFSLSSQYMTGALQQRLRQNKSS